MNIIENNSTLRQLKSSKLLKALDNISTDAPPDKTKYYVAQQMAYGGTLSNFVSKFTTI
jgi:hypothetical protein